MSSSKEYLDFVLEQLSDIDDISYRAMMGEYIIYYQGIVIGGIYDNRFLIKPTKSIMSLIPNAKEELPYEGAKAMYLIEELEDREYLKKVIQSVYSDLAK